MQKNVIRLCRRPIAAEIWAWIYEKFGYEVEVAYIVNLFDPSYIEVRGIHG